MKRAFLLQEACLDGWLLGKCPCLKLHGSYSLFFFPVYFLPAIIHFFYCQYLLNCSSKEQTSPLCPMCWIIQMCIYIELELQTSFRSLVPLVCYTYIICVGVGGRRGQIFTHEWSWLPGLEEGIVSSGSGVYRWTWVAQHGYWELNSGLCRNSTYC